MTFNIGDKVHVTEAYEDWYWRKMKDVPFVYPETPLIVIRVEHDQIWVRRDSKRQEPMCYAPPEYLTKDADTEHDTTQAVIEAARMVMAHVQADILVDRVTGDAFLHLVATESERPILTTVFSESDDDLPNTLAGALVTLRAALDAYDESEDTE